MNIYINFIVIILLNFITTINTQSLKDCPINEIYYNSFGPSPICDFNCQNLERPCPLTSERSVAGCYCKINYARNLQQKCIPIEKCAGDCGSNERPIAPLWSGCEKICRTSPTGLRITICYRLAERRCVCSSDFCRRGGRCIKNF